MNNDFKLKAITKKTFLKKIKMIRQNQKQKRLMK